VGGERSWAGKTIIPIRRYGDGIRSMGRKHNRSLIRKGGDRLCEHFRKKGERFSRAENEITTREEDSRTWYPEPKKGQS